MRDIDNNLNKLNNYNTKNYQKQISETAQISDESLEEQGIAQKKEINDLSALPSVTFGKAMITADNTEADMMFLLKNQKHVEQINSIVDKYLENHSQEEAVQLIDVYKNEFIQPKNKH